MMRIAILGATSQIARNLIISFSKTQETHLHLFSRRPGDVTKWVAAEGLSGRYLSDDYSAFADQDFDAVINFVGVGNPAQAVAMGNAIFDITYRFDEMVLDYLRTHPACRYLFLSSGAAYGANFDEPVDEDSKACVAINHLQSQDWYAIAKMYAECRHRSLPHLPIVDIRVFNYFSHTQDINTRFLISDILRAIQAGDTLTVSSENIVRDFIGSDDFYQLVSGILAAAPSNDVVDCYSKSPVDKMTLLDNMQKHFGLRYKIKAIAAGINATGAKSNYFSQNRRAEKFGYKPAHSSLENVIREAGLVLKGTK